ncbi:hypothetical protein NHX12_013523 [Muraenolepis orangiensis]|uniref:Uncharacterized protein n=1 Tax=Muraenolepis orangiensis TaxID=630683 RepID=A0A9Q0DGJ1_9TELE|nr:hypothetical protein NHX12_013523 [Muraenolepis orangiensis]
MAARRCLWSLATPRRQGEGRDATQAQGCGAPECRLHWGPWAVTSQDNTETGPSTWSQQSSDSDGGSNSNDDFYLNAGNTGWAQNGGQDSGAYDPIPYRAEGDSEDVEEGSVWSDVSDLEPVYSFSSKSSYQHGRHVSIRTSYTPGDYAMPASNDEPVVPEWPGKGSPKVGY